MNCAAGTREVCCLYCISLNLASHCIVNRVTRMFGLRASEQTASVCASRSSDELRPRMDGRALRSIGSWGPRLNDVSVRIQVFCSLSPHLKIHLNVFCFTRRRLFRNHSLSNADVMHAVSFVWHQTPLPESLLVARQRRDSGALFSQIE